MNTAFFLLPNLKSPLKSEARVLSGYDILMNGKSILARNVRAIENDLNIIGFIYFDLDTDDELSKMSRKSFGLGRF